MGGAAGVPPVERDPEDSCARGVPCWPAVGSSVGSAAGNAGVSVTATGAPVPGGCPPPGVAAGPGAESEHVQFHVQFQAERVEAFGAAVHAPFQFHTHVQVSGMPAASADPPPAEEAGVETPLLSAAAAGVDTACGEALTPGADA
jgi:hypothetical protein